MQCASPSDDVSFLEGNSMLLGTAVASIGKSEVRLRRRVVIRWLESVVFLWSVEL